MLHGHTFRGALLAPYVTHTAFVLVCLALPASADDRELFLREVGARSVAPAGALEPSVPSVSADGVASAVSSALDALARAEAEFLSYSFADAAAGLLAVGQRVNGSLVASRRDLIVRIDLWVGACSLLANQPIEARAAFRRALSLEPEATLPPGVFPPEVQATFEEAVRARHSAGSAGRTITTEPTNARVWVDGRPVGISPVSVSLVLGTHYLAVERVGYHRFTDRVLVEAEGLTAPLVVALRRASVDELREQASSPQGLSEPPDALTLEAMARAFGVRRAVFARADGSFVRVPDARVAAGGGARGLWVLGASVGGSLVISLVIYGAVALSRGGDGATAPRLELVLGF